MAMHEWFEYKEVKYWFGSYKDMWKCVRCGALIQYTGGPPPPGHRTRGVESLLLSCDENIAMRIHES